MTKQKQSQIILQKHREYSSLYSSLNWLGEKEKKTVLAERNRLGAPGRKSPVELQRFQDGSFRDFS